MAHPQRYSPQSGQPLLGGGLGLASGDLTTEIPHSLLEVLDRLTFVVAAEDVLDRVAQAEVEVLSDLDDLDRQPSVVRWVDRVGHDASDRRWSAKADGSYRAKISLAHLALSSTRCPGGWYVLHSSRFSGRLSLRLPFL